MENNYEVGFGKPPRDSQFKPGHSGNNNGRPKGSKNKNLYDLMVEELDNKIQLKDGTKIAKGEAAVKQVCNKAASGDHKSIQLIMNATARQQPIALAKEFLDKLIRENYLTEKNAKDYLNHGTILNLQVMPEAISKLYCITDSNITWANATLSSLLLLSDIRRVFMLSVRYGVVLEALAKEYGYWQGVDEVLSYLELSEKERTELINKIAQGRKYKRPDDFLYCTAVKAYSFWIFQTMASFNNMRDASKNTPGYDEAEKLLLNDEIKNHALANAKYKMKEADFESLEEDLDRSKDDYITFNEASPLTDKDYAMFKEDPTDQETQALMSWYGNTSK